MATITISDQAKADAEELVREGRFETVDAAVEAALHFFRNPWIDEVVDLDDLDPETRAAVEEGLADADAGRVRDASEVFDELIARYEAMAKERKQPQARAV